MNEPMEIIPPDEAARFEGYGREIKALQEARMANTGRHGRVAHVKCHFSAVGELTVNANLDAKLAVGVFAEPRTYPLYARISNGGAGKQSDKVAETRAISLKLVGVQGKKVIAGLEDKLTQDFLFLHTRSTATKTPEDFMIFVKHARNGTLALLWALLRGIGVGRTLALVREGTSISHVTSVATIPFFTVTPIRWGKSAAKLALFPHATDPPRGQGDAAVRDDARARLREGPVRFTLKAQLFVDEEKTPIEPGTHVWPESVSPFHELGTLTLHKQDLESLRGQEIDERVEKLSFDPWHAVEAHRPLGAVMRARAVTYREAVITRGAADEPTDVLSPSS